MARQERIKYKGFTIVVDRYPTSYPIRLYLPNEPTSRVYGVPEWEGETVKEAKEFVDCYDTRDHEEIIKRAWALYHSPAKAALDTYCKFDALFDVVQAYTTETGVVVSDREYKRLMDEMECE